VCLFHFVCLICRILFIHSLLLLFLLSVLYIYIYICVRVCMQNVYGGIIGTACIRIRKNFRVLWRDKTVANVGVMCVLITEIMGQ